MTETTWADAPRMAALTATKEYEQGLGDRTVESPLFGWVTAQLVGTDGNAFALIGQVTSALKRAGLYEEAKALSADVMETSGSYDELLQHLMKTVEVA